MENKMQTFLQEIKHSRIGEWEFKQNFGMKHIHIDIFNFVVDSYGRWLLMIGNCANMSYQYISVKNNRKKKLDIIALCSCMLYAVLSHLMM